MKVNAKQSFQEKYNSFLNKVLSERLFESGINLNQMLIESFSVSSDNARQIVKRAVAQKAIKSSYPYTFGKGQYIYLYNEYELGKSSIKAITKISRPPIYRLLQLMDRNNGILSYYEGLKITASPMENSSTKVSTLEDILSLFAKLDIIYQKRDNNNVVYILFKEDKEELQETKEQALMANHFAKMVIDCSVLPDILSWLGRSNLIDSINSIYRNKKTPGIGAKHNNLIWDAYTYTRSTGINPTLGSKADTLEKKTLSVLDVVLSEEYSAEHLDAFYDRIQINRNSTKEVERKILPIIVYKSSSAHTINKIAKLGIIAFDIGSIFGTKIYDILNRTHELSIFFKESEKIDQTIEGILNAISEAGQEDALKELRGTLFEFLMYPLLASLYPLATIERGKTLTRQNDIGKKEGYEYDYIIQSTNPPEIVFVELKGYHSRATIPLGNEDTKGSIKWFFSRTLPFAIKEYKSEIGKGKVAKGVYITSAAFWKDGKEFLEIMDKGKLKSLNLNTGYDRDQLIELLNQRGFRNEIKIIKKFYTQKEEEHLN